jgi:hypothetical protein
MLRNLLFAAKSILVGGAISASTKPASAATFTVATNGPVITHMCGGNPAGCSWCSHSSGKCYFVAGCGNGTCTVISYIHGRPSIGKGRPVSVSTDKVGSPPVTHRGNPPPAASQTVNPVLFSHGPTRRH